MKGKKKRNKNPNFGIPPQNTRPTSTEESAKTEIQPPAKKYLRLEASLHQNVTTPRTPSLDNMQAMPHMLLRPSPKKKLEVEKCAEHSSEG